MAASIFSRAFARFAPPPPPPPPPDEPSRLSAAGLRALTRLEGSVNHAYKDSAGYLTIGVGHLLTPTEKARGTILIGGDLVPWKGVTLSAGSIAALLGQDVAWAERDVADHVAVALKQHQFDALVIFVFNVGPTAFGKSSLLRRLNAGAYDAVPAQLARWRCAGGKVSKGLIYRRAQEAAIWRGT